MATPVNRAQEYFGDYLTTPPSLQEQGATYAQQVAQNNANASIEMPYLNQLYGVAGQTPALYYPGIAPKEMTFITALLIKGVVPVRDPITNQLSWQGQPTTTPTPTPSTPTPTSPTPTPSSPTPTPSSPSPTPSTYTLPIATTSTLGGVILDGTTITVSGTGVISAIGGIGATGAQGIQGVQGPQGPQGIPGQTGPEGPQGPAGTSGSGTLNLNDVTIGYTGAVNVTPVGNGSLATTSGLQVQGTTTQNNQREWMGVFGLVSNKGASATNNLGDKVALYAGVEAQQGTGNVWALNTVNIVDAGVNCVSQGYECDNNNNSADRSNDFVNSMYGIDITGASQFNCTGAMLISEASPYWYRGILFANNGISYDCIEDRSYSNTFIKTFGSHELGVDLSSADYTTAAIRLTPGETSGILSWQGNYLSVDYCDTVNNRFVGIGSAAVFVDGQFFLPISNGGTIMGGPTNQFADLYLSGSVVSSSDIRKKTNVEELPSVLKLFEDIKPIKYKKIDGGKKRTPVTRTKVKPVTQTITRDVEEHTIVDGKAVLIKTTKQHEEPVFEEYKVHDLNGEPVIDVKTHGPNAAVTAHQRIHKVQKQSPQNVTEYDYLSQPGKRTHYGFSAQEVQEAFQKNNLGDFGGHVLAENGDHFLRYDEMIPLLWKAVSELAEQVNQLKGQK